MGRGPSCRLPLPGKVSVTLKAYFEVLRERWRTLAILVLLGVAAGVALTALTPKVYQASAQVLATSGSTTDQGLAIQGGAFAQSQVQTLAATIDAPSVLNAVIKDLNLAESPRTLRDKISAAAPSNQALIVITAQDGEPSRSAAIANSAARAFVTAGETFETPRHSNTTLIKLSVTNPAVAPTSPAEPKALVNIAGGFLIGLVLGLSLAIVRDLLDNRLKSIDQTTVATGLPAMGAIVEDKNATRHVIATRAGRRNLRAENFRQLRTNLQFANVDRMPRIIAVTSSIPGEGKSSTVINLASTMAEAGFTVALVDADLRRPSIADTLGLVPSVGLTSVLINQISLSEALQNAGGGFYVLTSGPIPPNPSEVLASVHMRDVVDELAQKMDFVLIDTAPLLPVADGVEVAALAEGTFLVVRHGITTVAQVKRATHALEQVNASVLGFVLNRVPVKGAGADGYAYTYYSLEKNAAAHTQGTREIDS